MPRNPFGFDLPAGAATDPSAPYNQPDQPECPECGSTDTEEAWDSNSWSGYEDWFCNNCELSWLIQVGPDPDDARDQARDDKLTGD